MKKEKYILPEDFEPIVASWQVLKFFVKQTLQHHLKRYIGVLIVAFIFFLIPGFILLPIHFFSNDYVICIFSVIFSVLAFLIIGIPSILALIDVFHHDVFFYGNDLELPGQKYLFRAYFSGFLKSLKLFTLNKSYQVKVCAPIGKAFLLYVILVSAVIIPSHFFKISADPEYFSFLNNLETYFNLGNSELLYSEFLSIFKFYRLEFYCINLVTSIFFVIVAMYTFNFIIFHRTLISGQYPTKESKKIFNITKRKNKWTFAAYFVNGFKYLIITYVVLSAGLTVLFYYFVDDCILGSVLVYYCSVAALFITIPFFIMYYFNLSLEFSDLFIEGEYIYLKSLLLKEKYSSNQILINRVEVLSKIVEKIRIDKRTYLKLLKKDPEKLKDYTLTLEEKNEIIKQYYFSIMKPENKEN